MVSSKDLSVTALGLSIWLAIEGLGRSKGMIQRFNSTGLPSKILTRLDDISLTEAQATFLEDRDIECKLNIALLRRCFVKDLKEKGNNGMSSSIRKFLSDCINAQPGSERTIARITTNHLTKQREKELTTNPRYSLTTESQGKEVQDTQNLSKNAKRILSLALPSGISPSPQTTKHKWSLAVTISLGQR